MSNNWFEALMGFQEENPEQVRAQIRVEGNKLRSLANGKSFEMGFLEIPQLHDLRAAALLSPKGPNRLREVVADVQVLHGQEAHAGALFQAASQFNLLEMVGPHVRPEEGITRYAFDKTQGPACAIACGAGTIFRNYLVDIDGQKGQEGPRQIDCLADLAAYFQNDTKQYWQMQNGYALASQEGLQAIAEHLQALSAADYEKLKGLLRVGIQWKTEVTLGGNGQCVNQIYCSALPVAYSSVASKYWEAFARFILQASYEATFWAAVHNRAQTGNKQLFLTLLGGGAFGNANAWIEEALLHNLQRFAEADLDIAFVSYGQPNPLVRRILARFA